MNKILMIHEGFRFLKNRILANKMHKEYEGTALEICEKILEDRWNSKHNFYMTGKNNYKQFYCRDFGWATEALIRIGKKDRVKKTLVYALERFRKHGKITQCISPKGIPYDYFGFGSDSLPFLARSVAILKDKELELQYKEFLEKETSRYLANVVDEKTGLPKKKHLVGMRDHAIRDRACYDTCMIGMLKNQLNILGIKSILDNFDYKKILIENYWKEDYFLDDLSGYDWVTGDANIMPFYTGIIKEKKMFDKVLKKIQRQGLDKPFPLRYFHKKTNEHKKVWESVFLPNWEMDTVWGHIGMIFLDVLDKLKMPSLEYYLELWKIEIEKNKGFVELYTPEGKPYKSLFYHADEGMIWSAILVSLWKRA